MRSNNLRVYTLTVPSILQIPSKVNAIGLLAGGRFSNFLVRSYSLMRSTEMVHSPIRAATAPTAARTGRNTAPTTPMVSGNSMIVLPSLSLIVMWRTLPWAIKPLTVFRRFSPETLIVSSVVLVFLVMHYYMGRQLGHLRGVLVGPGFEDGVGEGVGFRVERHSPFARDPFCDLSLLQLPEQQPFPPLKHISPPLIQSSWDAEEFNLKKPKLFPAIKSEAKRTPSSNKTRLRLLIFRGGIFLIVFLCIEFIIYH